MNPYRVIEVGRGAVNHLIRSHYLHRWPGVVTAVMALMDASTPIGALVFALPPRETAKRYGVEVAWELARLFVVDETPKNTETWFMARAIKWVRANRPDVQVLVSYADPSAGHSGTIYKAGNWISDGMSDQERNTPRFDYRTDGEETLFGVSDAKRHARAAHVPDGAAITRTPRVSKHRYIYWLDGRHEKRRASKRAPQTKG